MLVQFDHVPGADDTRTLAERGAQVLGYVHENGVLVAASDPDRLDGLGLQWAGPLTPGDKISPLLLSEAEAGDRRAVVIEVHPDVSLETARRAALDAGFTLWDNPDLTSQHVLAEGTLGQIGELADRDEVAYIFPASAPLSSGQPQIACAGALTAQGAAGQYIATMGDGWDGPGKNSASLNVSFSDLTAQIPADLTRAEILRALQEWAKYVKLSFIPGGQPDAPRTINILFASGSHGDEYSFDGPGGVLAHTFYPPPNAEPLAGDMHFDDDEHWRVGNDKDVFSVALHEAGHALGLGHSDRPGAVMYPYYSQVSSLTPEDIGAIQELYAPQDGEPAPVTPVAPAPPVPVVPTPVPTPTAPPSPAPIPPAPKPEPLSLTLAPVSSSTAASSITLTGATAGGYGTAVVSWTTDRGQSGIAQGTAVWTAQIPLTLASNVITITAADAQHSAVSRTVSITRQPPAAAPVEITLSYPAATGILSSSQPQLNLRGAASHTSGIQFVRWSNDRGGSGQASGTSSWDSGSITLKPGLNRISIVATAGDGSTGSRVVQATYVSDTAHDTTAPALTILSPDSTTPLTSSDSIVVRGTASDNVGVTEVTWFTSTGLSGSATGTNSWVTPPVPLLRGYNSIVVRAFDASGNVGWRVVMVTRQ